MIELRTKEIYRFLGYRNITPTPEIDERIRLCVEKMQAAASPRCFYRKFSISQTSPDITHIAGLTIKSKNLYRNLQGCEEAYMFAATVGLGIDQLIKRSEVTSIMDAAIYQAAGAEMVEAFADSEMNKLRAQEAEKGFRLRPRYSPGYGDLPLALQTDFARILDMQKWCGISLTDTLLMVPSKSITAFIGCVKAESTEKSSPDSPLTIPVGAMDNDDTYLADIVNPLEATGLSAKESTGSKKICRNTLPETSCTQCSMASECMYRHPNFNHSEGDNKCVKTYWNV